MGHITINTDEAAAAVPNGWDLERFPADMNPTVSEDQPARRGDRIIGAYLDPVLLRQVAQGALPVGELWPAALDAPAPVFEVEDRVLIGRSNEPRTEGMVVMRLADEGDRSMYAVATGQNEDGVFTEVANLYGVALTHAPQRNPS